MKKERTSNSNTPSSCHPDEGRISNTQNNINHINTNIMKTNRVIRFIKNSINNLKSSIMNRNAQNPENVETNSTNNFFNTLLSKIMNKKIKNVEELEASSIHTNKFGSIGATLLVVITVIAFSAFTQISKKGNTEEACFSFIAADNPNDTQSTNSLNYSTEEMLSCLPLYQTLCGVCFDPNHFPLDINGKPDFINNPDLESIVKANKSATGTASKTVQVPGTTDQWVTLHYRQFKPD